MMKTKRILSLVLTLCMLTGLCLGGAASAAGNSAKDAAPAGGYLLTGITRFL